MSRGSGAKAPLAPVEEASGSSETAREAWLNVRANMPGSGFLRALKRKAIEPWDGRMGSVVDAVPMDCWEFRRETLPAPPQWGGALVRVIELGTKEVVEGPWYQS